MVQNRTDTLSCGCSRSHSCPEADRLWDQVIALGKQTTAAAAAAFAEQSPKKRLWLWAIKDLLHLRWGMTQVFYHRHVFPERDPLHEISTSLLVLRFSTEQLQTILLAGELTDEQLRVASYEKFTDQQQQSLFDWWTQSHAPIHIEQWREEAKKK